MLQSRHLFTELPEPLGVLITEGLGLRSLDSAVRVVEASLSLQTLVHSAEDRGLSPGLGGLMKIELQYVLWTNQRPVLRSRDLY